MAKEKVTAYSLERPQQESIPVTGEVVTGDLEMVEVTQKQTDLGVVVLENGTPSNEVVEALKEKQLQRRATKETRKAEKELEKETEKVNKAAGTEKNKKAGPPAVETKSKTPTKD